MQSLRKPLHFIVMSVMVVISSPFAYTYRVFLHDGGLVGGLGSVIVIVMEKLA